jgi:biotin synthase-like enzyme
LRLARALRETGVEQIALRASELDEDSRQDVLKIIKYVRKAQGLEDTTTEGHQDEQPAKEDGKQA